MRSVHLVAAAVLVSVAFAQPRPEGWMGDVEPRKPIESFSNIPKGLLIQGAPSAAMVPPPVVRRLVGEFRSCCRGKYWGEDRYEVWLGEKERVGLRASSLVPDKQLTSFVGKTVEVIAHELPGRPGMWRVSREPVISQKPSFGIGTDDPRPLKVDGKTVAWAEWIPGTPAGYEVLRIRRKGS